MFYVLVLVFWTTIFLGLTTYLFYPVSLALLSLFLKQRPRKAEYYPRISIIISAFNEEKDISRKITNTLELDYPKDKLEILIGSDGSTDGTNRILKELDDEQCRIFVFEQNRGKTSVQNDLVDHATGDILVFTDAASFLPADSVHKMIMNFADERVGCVAGRMRFINTDNNITTQSQGIYWRYEVKIREMESMLGSLIGVDGPLYAVRTTNYVPLANNIISDLITPLLVLEQGKKVYLERDAIVEEEPTQKGQHEFTTRRRITLRGLVGLFSHSSLLNPIKHPLLTLQIFCHKLLRWFVGPLIIINFISCFLLLFYNVQFFYYFFALYLIFFAAAYAGRVFEQKGVKHRILAIPYYFLLVNTAATLGIVDFFKKKQAVTWQTERGP
ncbi:MAG: glycosyltransferase family 2 protein [Candidatus Thiodiazotropha sp.]